MIKALLELLKKNPEFSQGDLKWHHGIQSKAQGPLVTDGAIILKGLLFTRTHAIGTWNVKTTNQEKIEPSKQY